MKYLFTLPLAVAAFLVACDSGSTAPDPYIRGNLIYERHIDPNAIGSMQCNVYATDNVIMVESNVNSITENSNMGAVLEANFGKNPATYRGEYDMSGAYLMLNKQSCEQAKEEIAEMENGKTSCSSNKASFTSTVPNITETNKLFYVSSVKSAMENYCDQLYEHATEAFTKMLNQLNPQGDVTEKALSCDIQADGNNIKMSVMYSDKSSVVTATYLGDYKYSVREEYTGIDDATLARVCETYKNDDDNSKVVCSGSVFTFESIGPDVETYVESVKKFQCPAMLRGGMTLEDSWFNSNY